MRAWTSPIGKGLSESDTLTYFITSSLDKNPGLDTGTRMASFLVPLQAARIKLGRVVFGMDELPSSQIANGYSRTSLSDALGTEKYCPYLSVLITEVKFNGNCEFGTELMSSIESCPPDRGVWLLVFSF
jgi:hypothetical protein